ncbi:hypothetical protein VUJ46_01365 [Chryseobacterium sp. MYb264]|uniref:hypothetical protein n=1 Tax=Chryseobacterium sp. MYb264 TaxID=2745153 RepID=UPI002E0F9D58|nr:hypothetical protein VUJ46_01365 [Chryseobacterium sp. MYb264]
MKKRIVLLVLAFFLVPFGSKAQTRYEKEMTTALEALYKANDLTTYKTLANKFEAISRVEKDQWLPKYYVSYVYTVLAHFEKETDRKDQSLETAQNYFDKSKAQSGNKEELAILQAYIHQSSFFVSPMARLNDFGTNSTEIEGLLKTYPNNPRINLLQGIQLFNKPGFLGGGAAKAKPFFQKAEAIYNKSQNVNSLNPNWGRTLNTIYLKKSE